MNAAMKNKALAVLADTLREALAAAEASQGATQAGAVHEESRAENEKDTRATEASYLARGLAERTENLREALAKLDAFRPVEGAARVRVGSLIELENDDGSLRRYLIAPVGGGAQLVVDDATITVLTPNAPLATRLLGCEAEDEILLPGNDAGAARIAAIT